MKATFDFDPDMLVSELTRTEKSELAQALFDHMSTVDYLDVVSETDLMDYVGRARARNYFDLVEPD